MFEVEQQKQRTWKKLCQVFKSLGRSHIALCCKKTTERQVSFSWTLKKLCHLQSQRKFGQRIILNFCKHNNCFRSRANEAEADLVIMGCTHSRDEIESQSSRHSPLRRKTFILFDIPEDISEKIDYDDELDVVFHPVVTRNVRKIRSKYKTRII